MELTQNTRKTKIICTLGPASRNEKTLEEMKVDEENINKYIENN